MVHDKTNRVVAPAMLLWLGAIFLLGPQLDNYPAFSLPLTLALLAGAVGFAILYHRKRPASAEEKHLYGRMSLYVLAGAAVVMVTRFVGA